VLNEQLTAAQEALGIRIDKYYTIAERLPKNKGTVISLEKQIAEAKEENERIHRLMSLEYKREEHFKKDWKSFRGRRFERWVKRAFELLDLAVIMTIGSGDEGIDLVVQMDGWKLGVEVKGRKEGTKITGPQVRQSFSGIHPYGCGGFAFITNSEFTGPAIDYADGVNCVLINKNNMKSFVMGNIEFRKARLSRPHVDSPD